MATVQKVIAVLILLSLPSLAKAQTATISWSTTYQTIDGFGASDAFCINQSGYNTCSLTDAQADLFFSPTAVGGVGLSLLRSEIPDDGSCSGTCSIPDIVTMTKAISRGAKVWATPWSPPASMKSNGSTVCNSGSGALNGGSYGAFAAYLTNYARQLQSMHGIALYALSVQNEPDFCPSYDGALWSGSNFHDFIKSNLGPAFAGAGLSTKIMLPETAGSNDLASTADTTMNDGSSATFVGIVATHDYASPGTANPVTYTNGGKPLWETETSDFNSPDPSIASGLAYAKQIHDWLTTGATAWHFWWMVNNNADNEGLIQSDGTITKRLYTIGNFSRFVRPGYVRIDATASPISGVYVSAYKNPANGTFAIVAVNTNGSSQSMTFSLNGFTAATVAPWLTDANNNLSQGSSISASNSFGATLGASSVTTFVGSAGSIATPPPPPTDLIITGIR